jgi:hypothetical protein
MVGFKEGIDTCAHAQMTAWGLPRTSNETQVQPDSSSQVMEAQYLSARSVLRCVVVGRNWKPGSKGKS